MAAPLPTHASSTLHPAGPRTFRNGFFFGIPLGDLGWFASLLIALATGFAAFFAATFLGIVTLLIRQSAGHPVDYAIAYRLIGLPVGAAVLLLALACLGTLWLKRITAKTN